MVESAFFEVTLWEPESTVILGNELAARINDRLIFALKGPLGAGKTTFARGVGQALGVTEVINSPTFTMINEYTTGTLPMFHLDLYRLGEQPGDSPANPSGTRQWLELELEELKTLKGIVLIEWSEYVAKEMVDCDHIAVELNYSKLPESSDKADEQAAEGGRVARVFGYGADASRIVEAVRKIYFS